MVHLGRTGPEAGADHVIIGQSSLATCLILDAAARARVGPVVPRAASRDWSAVRRAREAVELRHDVDSLLARPHPSARALARAGRLRSLEDVAAPEP